VSGSPLVRGSVSNAERNFPSPLSPMRVNSLQDVIGKGTPPSPRGGGGGGGGGVNNGGDNNGGDDGPRGSLDQVSEDPSSEDAWLGVMSSDDLLYDSPDVTQTTIFLGYDEVTPLCWNNNNNNNGGGGGGGGGRDTMADYWSASAEKRAMMAESQQQTPQVSTTTTTTTIITHYREKIQLILKKSPT